MLFRPRALARHARWRSAARLAVGLWPLFHTACTEPSFYASGDGEEHRDAGPPPSGDGRDAGDTELDATATRIDADVCEDCRGDAGGVSSEGSVPPLDARVAVDGQIVTAPNHVEPPQPVAGLDPVRSLWAGRYAARSFVFAYSPLIETFAKYLTLVQIKPGADGGLVIEEEICRFESAFTAVFSAHFSFDYTGVSVRGPLSFDGERFSSMSAAVTVGYGAAPSDCAGGMTSRSSSPPRPWLMDNVCECPRDPAALPTSAKDCRVSDYEGDGFAGATFRATLESSEGIARAAQEHRLRLLNGYRSGDRLYAQREFTERTNALSCTVDGRPVRIADCPLGTPGACPAEFNPVELVRIADHYGCRDIIEREQGWFTSPRPAFPTACHARAGQTQ